MNRKSPSPPRIVTCSAAALAISCLSAENLARYVLAKKNNVNLRFDAACGRGEHLFYVGIGEAF